MSVKQIARQQKLSKLTVGSIWRVETADEDQTSKYQPCKILDLLENDVVRVRYLDYADKDEEPLEYDIPHTNFS